jgi:hypothetical protein
MTERKGYLNIYCVDSGALGLLVERLRELERPSH